MNHAALWRQGLTNQPPPFLPKQPLNCAFGSSWAVDFSLLVFHYLYGSDFIDSYIRDPGELLHTNLKVDMDWAFKRHPAHRLPDFLESMVSTRLIEVGIED